MWVKDFKGREHNWRFQSRSTGTTSSGHRLARELLNEIFPYKRIYEEVEIPGTRMYLDFLIPSLPLAIEIQGQQHFNHIPHFHGSRENFIKQIQRDIKKKEWLELNKIPLILLDDKESVDVWRSSITDYYKR